MHAVVEMQYLSRAYYLSLTKAGLQVSQKYLKVESTYRVHTYMRVCSLHPHILTRSPQPIHPPALSLYARIYFTPQQRICTSSSSQNPDPSCRWFLLCLLCTVYGLPDQTETMNEWSIRSCLVHPIVLRWVKTRRIEKEK